MTDKVKQVIIWRGDLKNVPKGRIAAQVAHASWLWMLRRLPGIFNDLERTLPTYKTCVFSHRELEWLEESFIKVVLVAPDLPALQQIHVAAQHRGIESHLMEDDGFIEGEKSTICALAIGPDLSSYIDPLTRHLRLL